MNPAAKKAKPAAPRKPDVIVGDEVFFHHAKGPRSGKVAAHGEHGCTMASGHRVPWQHVLGHKKRATQQYSVDEEGEDGMILKDRNGLRQYLAVPPESRAQGEDTPMLTKSGNTLRLLMIKADAPAKAKKKAAKGEDEPHWKPAGEDDEPPKRGHHVGWVNGEHRGHGRVMSAGKHGVMARDGADGLHPVRHEHITHRWHGDGEPTYNPHDAEAEAANARTRCGDDDGDDDK